MSESKEWLVYQVVIMKETQTIQGNAVNNNISIQTIVRKVTAISKDEAIGKFISGTSGFGHERRIDPINCFEFDKLATIV